MNFKRGSLLSPALEYGANRGRVNFSAPDNIKGSVSRYLNRELRSLNDVEIVENGPEWIIYMVAVELKTVGGYKSGVAI